jgi:very-short-patch-repair endonuclease
MEERISELASRQFGLVSRQQLLALGLTPDSARRHVTGCRHVHPGVYALPGTSETFDQRVFAATLAAGDGAVASHRAAAALLGLEVEPAVEITVLHGRRIALAGVTVHRTRTLPADHRSRVRGIPVTDAERTICDLKGALDAEEFAYVFGRALSSRRIALWDLRRTLRRLPRLPGRRSLVALIDERRGKSRGRAESRLEKELHRFLERVGITGWEPQLEQKIAGQTYFIDVAFAGPRVALEMDSYLYHSSHAAWAKDHTRTRDLTIAGWRVIPVTQEDLRDGADAFLARLRHLLGEEVRPRLLPSRR